MDHGTLCQLQRLINRRDVVKDPSRRVAPCEEFFLLVVEAHILAVAMNMFEMESLSDTPCTKHFPPQSIHCGSQERCRILMVALQEMMKKYVNIEATFDDGKQHAEADGVQAYAREVLSLGLMLMEFNDAIREGDGTRILRCWRYFLLLFKASNRTNYSIEAFTLLAQHKYLFSPRMAMQLQWSRTINVHGRPGKNIPADLHMEHLNRLCKDCIGGLGANITDKSIERAGRCLKRLERTLQQYDSENGVKEISGMHTKHSMATDLNRMLSELTKCAVFSCRPGRAHRNFPKFLPNMIKQLNQQKLLNWMQDHMNKLVMYK